MVDRSNSGERTTSPGKTGAAAPERDRNLDPDLDLDLDLDRDRRPDFSLDLVGEGGEGGAADVVALGPYEAQDAAAHGDAGSRTASGVWVRTPPPAQDAGGLSPDDVFDTGFDYFSSLLGPRGGRGAPGKPPPESYHTYDSFLFEADQGRHPRLSLAARDEE